MWVEGRETRQFDPAGLPTEQPAGLLEVAARNVRLPPQAPSTNARLLLEEVGAECLPAAQAPGSGHLDALGSATVGLHLRHVRYLSSRGVSVGAGADSLVSGAGCVAVDPSGPAAVGAAAGGAAAAGATGAGATGAAGAAVAAGVGVADAGAAGATGA